MKKQFILTILLFALATGCTTIEPVDINISAAPDKDEKNASALEQRMRDAGYYFLMLNYKTIDETTTYHRLRRLGIRISQYTERPNIKYNYVIIDSKYPTAFSYPGGLIVFTNAMLDELQTDENIQAVIAHEIAHVTHKHGLKLYEKQMGRSGLQKILGNQLTELVSGMGHHKAAELQADQTATRYLYRSGLDPHSYVAMMEKLKDIEQLYERILKEDEENKPSRQERQLNKLLRLQYPELNTRIVNARNHITTLNETETIQYNPADFNF